jgi:hypothetical protein
LDGQPDYTIEVETAAQGCTWIVRRADRPALSGHAPDRRSAQRYGAFAAAALHGLDRIARRNF